MLLRRVLREQIERVQQGLDPLGVIRDPHHPTINTNLHGEAQGARGEGLPTGLAAPTVPVGEG